MENLQNKNIVIGITGGIAAYKTIELIRLLKKSQANVRVVLTPAAKAFVTPLTLQAISGNHVAESLLDPSAELAMGHIELAKWADLVVIAPASADFIARLRVGMANDLLSTLCLATSAPILLAPAMNQQMYHQAITQENLATLQTRGVRCIGPNAGEQACGDVGKGRMSEPAEIYQAIQQSFVEPDCQGLSVVITTGATREALDPVRFLSNHSSGKMGFALAEDFAKRGAKVTVIAGSVNLPTPQGVERINIVSAEDMLEAAKKMAPHHDIFIACAAVADFRPAEVCKQKMKKDPKMATETMTLTLIKNPDIVAMIAAMQENRPFVVGFAAETQDVADYAKDKLVRKNLDMICANDVSNGKGFNQEQNAIQLFWKVGETIHEKSLPLASKLQLGNEIIDAILMQFKK
ncbi:bifunctional phosphopantothenoylcysteine decarboxylase/phosphopantothenate synthase [Actinobacillus delphinicola]|uniref:bifunctional phosphopantothenoylcysteine decarboxylase/phosphopantothenate--cysteine ligase CoaBC n=1 Tax=Actinobacillus delphinicola TaxID=51161 RepID=UPI0024431F0A|nr:bifunctional phosphopantothenoylcysteine decarboxylase/phosphopantothenate--cysteine ligase CoaBC [Actinobacillus delphinicola]MDG6897324.1 bifunctional phosphopantothenoylcysteine decarboxylase/phosphopantothenate synthase [Actinobacillus delphinicola]